jgi:hypothetical protein
MIRNEIIRKEGVVYVGQWEPIYFQKQNGNFNHENVQEVYDFKRSEEYVKHCASIGVNQVWNNFFKGYGMQFEDSEQQRLKEFVKVCHKYDVKVFSYCTFGTLVMETLLPEEAGAEDWIAKPDIF